MNRGAFDAMCWKHNYKTYLLAAEIHVDGVQEVNVATREHSQSISVVGKWCVHYTIVVP